jgi:nucleoside-diphosphate-sugar epimerase
MKSVVLFGGTGFIGTHLTQALCNFQLAENIYLVDLKPPDTRPYTRALQQGMSSGRVIYVNHDVRQPIPSGLLPDGADLVFNLAAVHREPGHAPHEYFETNLLGAENVCDWAERVDCKTVVFTSSISPYGPSDEKKTETSVPVPETPYGSSKLAAEKVHMMWQAAGQDRKLLILRPGVVFGPGEGGNVTRLVRSLVKGYFVYMGNRSTIKAAGYVKELCLVTLFGLDTLRKGEAPYLVLNFTMDPPPTMQQMVETILRVIDSKRIPLNLPRSLLLGLSYPISGLSRIAGIDFPINPVRMRKLFRSNNIQAQKLQSLNYQYAYTLESAFLDWKEDCPEDFGNTPVTHTLVQPSREPRLHWKLQRDETARPLLPEVHES